MRIISSKLLRVAFTLCFVGGPICLASGTFGGKERRTSPARVQEASPLDLNGSFSGVIYYPNGSIINNATMVINGGNFRIDGGGKRLLSGTISGTLETITVRGVPRTVSFGVMQIEGGPKIELRPYKSGSTLKLLNRKLDGNPIFRFCSMDACACRRLVPKYACRAGEQGQGRARGKRHRR
jgi:hypothetical protein